LPRRSPHPPLLSRFRPRSYYSLQVVSNADLTGEDKRASAEAIAEVAGGKKAEAGPDVPLIEAAMEAVAMASVDPAPRELQLRLRRPRAQDLLPADHLDVVVGRALDGRPAKPRRRLDTCPRHRAHQRPGRDGGQLPCRTVRSLVERDHRVAVLGAYE